MVGLLKDSPSHVGTKREHKEDEENNLVRRIRARVALVVGLQDHFWTGWGLDTVCACLAGVPRSAFTASKTGFVQALMIRGTISTKGAKISLAWLQFGNRSARLSQTVTSFTPGSPAKAARSSWAPAPAGWL